MSFVKKWTKKATNFITDTAKSVTDTAKSVANTATNIAKDVVEGHLDQAVKDTYNALGGDLIHKASNKIEGAIEAHNEEKRALTEKNNYLKRMTALRAEQERKNKLAKNKEKAIKGKADIESGDTKAKFNQKNTDLGLRGNNDLHLKENLDLGLKGNTKLQNKNKQQGQ